MNLSLRSLQYPRKSPHDCILMIVRPSLNFGIVNFTIGNSPETIRNLQNPFCPYWLLSIMMNSFWSILSLKVSTTFCGRLSMSCIMLMPLLPMSIIREWRQCRACSLTIFVCFLTSSILWGKTSLYFMLGDGAKCFLLPSLKQAW